jgi:hypothetical protein
MITQNGVSWFLLLQVLPYLSQLRRASYKDLAV